MTPLTSLIEFHNTHPEGRENGAWHLARYPREVRDSVNATARRTTADACGIELRFVSNGPSVSLTLSCEDCDSEVRIYRGPFLVETKCLAQGVPTTLELHAPERLKEATDEILNSGGFSPLVWRIALGRGRFLLHHIERFGYTIRPPETSETPSTKWLAYGSSITHSNLSGYPYHAARLLHWDVYGKGLSGSCHIDSQITDYFASYLQEQCIDIVTAELGVNMRDVHTVEEFTQRARDFINTLRAAAPDTTLVLITAYTNSAHSPRENGLQRDERQMGFDQALRQLQIEANDPKLHLIEGTDLLPDFTLLSADVLHPTDSGQALMAHLLANRLVKLLPDDG